MWADIIVVGCWTLAAPLLAMITSRAGSCKFKMTFLSPTYLTYFLLMKTCFRNLTLPFICPVQWWPVLDSLTLIQWMKRGAVDILLFPQSTFQVLPTHHSLSFSSLKLTIFIFFISLFDQCHTFLIASLPGYHIFYTLKYPLSSLMTLQSLLMLAHQLPQLSNLISSFWPNTIISKTRLMQFVMIC